MNSRSATERERERERGREGSSAETWNRASRFRIKPVDFVATLRPSGHARRNDRCDRTIRDLFRHGSSAVIARVVKRNRLCRGQNAAGSSDSLLDYVTLALHPDRLLLARASIRIMEAVISVLLYGLPPPRISANVRVIEELPDSCTHGPVIGARFNTLG